MAATEWTTEVGYQYLSNETGFNLVRAGIEPFTQTVGGIPWIFGQLGIIFMVPAYIWIKSQNAVAAAFGQILITLVMKYFSVRTGWLPLNPFIEWVSYLSSVILLAGAIYMYFKAN